MTLGKKEFIDRLAKDSGCTKKDAELIVNEFTKGIERVLADGDNVRLSGFGSFEVKKRSPKSVRTLSGEMKPVPEHVSPKFVPGTKMRKVVKEGLFRE